LFVEGIDRDINSDIVTNIIRGPLIDFTVTMAQRYAIPVRQGFAMEEWDGRAKRWVGRTADLPFADSRPLLLVPRTFVRRRRGTFSADRYYRHYVLPEIQQQHLNSNSNLVRVLKSGVVRPPFKKTLQALYPDVKSTNVDSTINHSALLDDYRQDAERNFTVIGHSDLAKATGSRPDWDRVLQDVLQVPVGNPSAHDYHMAVEALLTAVLYPALDFPVIEREINHGRKRIDISYTNIATSGFFYWMHAVHNEPCSYIPVECKNYGREVNNREFDQLIGRFSVQQGKVGLLCYRGFTDKNLAIQRCRDALLAGQGIMIPIDDADLEEIVAERKRSQDGLDLRWFFDRFQQITS
ncbi:MAG TPA: hypothetical protein VHO01_07850, partial [Jatrophihabitans sp.]|nr:hypothetical protein [Jatrophihabitans sp.]